MQTTTLGALLALTLACAACTVSADLPGAETEGEGDAEVAAEALTAFPPALSVSINDPTQRALAVSPNVVAIRGFVSGNGIVPSKATVSLDGTTFQVPLQPGAGPYVTALGIRNGVGPGYTARVLPRLGVSYVIVQYQQP
jgi:hypothetical protein